jgi:hypothetical protein
MRILRVSFGLASTSGSAVAAHALPKVIGERRFFQQLHAFLPRHRRG